MAIWQAHLSPPLLCLFPQGSIGFPGFPGANGEKGTRVRVTLLGCVTFFLMEYQVVLKALQILWPRGYQGRNMRK